MAYEPKPVILLPVDSEDYTSPYSPEPLAVIGGIPVPAESVVALPAVPGTFADEAAVQTYLASLVTALKSSPYFS